MRGTRENRNVMTVIRLLGCVCLFLLIEGSSMLLLAGPDAAAESERAGRPAVKAPVQEMAQLDQPEAQRETAGTMQSSADLEGRKARSRFKYLMLGYGLIWGSLAVYLFQLNRGVAQVGLEIGELKVRLEEAEERSRTRG